MTYCLWLRDYPDSGSRYVTPDSGGECGVPYETYFPMPTAEKDKPWYSIEQASVHFTVISTEHDWTQNSEQVSIMKEIYHFFCIIFLVLSSFNLSLFYDMFNFSVAVWVDEQGHGFG